MLEYTGASRICALRIENFWERREKFCNINPTGEVPFLAVQKFEDGQKKHLLIASAFSCCAHFGHFSESGTGFPMLTHCLSQISKIYEQNLNF